MKTAIESKPHQQERIQDQQTSSLMMTRIPAGSYMITTTAIILWTMYYYTEGTDNDRTRIQIHQNMIQDNTSSEDNQEDDQQVNWRGFEIMAAMILLSILFRAAISSYQWYQRRKEAEAEAKQKEFEEMEETIRLMVHILLQERKTTRRQEDMYEDEPILATYERWDALTERMNDMGLLNTC